MATKSSLSHTITDEAALADFMKRIRRAEGQLGGIVRMTEEGRPCEDIVNQLAAVSKAIDKAAFVLITTGLKECLTEGKKNSDEVVERLQKLFLTMS